MAPSESSAYDANTYARFCGPQNLEKALNTLSGLVQGVLADQALAPTEAAMLRRWLDLHAAAETFHPYSEFLPIVREALEDNVLTEHERADILWLCERLKGDSPFYDRVTADLQRLQGLMAGIVADSQINVSELTSLADWLADHDHLRTTWPYEEVCGVLTSVMADGVVDPAEEQKLLSFFQEFMLTETKRVIGNPPVMIDGTVSGVCAVDPAIIVSGSSFCFTGKSSRSTRSGIESVVRGNGGSFVQTIRPNLDYLVIGNEGNRCWAYACYGRKIEQAIELRKGGARLMIVHENDFWDAVAELE
jgi:hypothetical protein